jgi:hypothetical protein
MVVTIPDAAEPATRSFGRVLDEVMMGEPHFPGDLRGWSRSTLDGCTAGAIREAGTVLEELVANAFHHAVPPYRIRLSTSSGGHLVRLTVTDGTPGKMDDWRLGRGLLIVGGLCRRWGVTADRLAVASGTVDGKTVWAQLPVLVPPLAATSR